MLPAMMLFSLIFIVVTGVLEAGWIMGLLTATILAHVFYEVLKQRRRSWYCIRCRELVSGNEVTYEELHEVCGGEVV